MHNATKADKDFKAIGIFSFVSRPPLPLFFLYLPPPQCSKLDAPLKVDWIVLLRCHLPAPPPIPADASLFAPAIYAIR